MNSLSSSLPPPHPLATVSLSFSQLFAHTTDAVCAVDAQQRILYWNRAAEMMLGYTPAEVAGVPCHQVLRAQDLHGRIFCCPNCALFQEAQAAADCPCRLLFLSTRTGIRRLFCVSTLAISAACRQNGGPTLIHLWRPLTLACCLSPSYTAQRDNEKRFCLLQALRLELEALLLHEQAGAPHSTPV